MFVIGIQNDLLEVPFQIDVTSVRFKINDTIQLLIDRLNSGYYGFRMVHRDNCFYLLFTGEPRPDENIEAMDLSGGEMFNPNDFESDQKVPSTEKELFEVDPIIFHIMEMVDGEFAEPEEFTEEFTGSQ
jgi:hypothetical protein